MRRISIASATYNAPLLIRCFI
ncbi:hypothetical protein CNECB9_2250006 [Cupriavidus necator]|uniref:Uncharacterized protein n=1 Tax=Cupriavidus necator TaxID=106590 RepID=A0A1K0ICS3_CUPNE|nr:hypothetical protein CNECB9_2250006 [Cupriavidus necator]